MLFASPHAPVSLHRPEPWGICDRCGWRYLLRQLAYQHQWSGMTLQNLHLRVCPECLDRPQEQLRAIIIGPDPAPVIDPRPGFYSTQEGASRAFDLGNGWPVWLSGITFSFEGSSAAQTEYVNATGAPVTAPNLAPATLTFFARGAGIPVWAPDQFFVGLPRDYQEHAWINGTGSPVLDPLGRLTPCAWLGSGPTRPTSPPPFGEFFDVIAGFPIWQLPGTGWVNATGAPN